MRRTVSIAAFLVVLLAVLSGTAVASDAGIDGATVAYENEANETNESNAITATSADNDSGISTADSHVESAVSVSPPGDSFARGETVDIWVGAFDNSGSVSTGVADETLTVTIESPTGETTDRTVTTDANGSAYVGYDLSDDAETGQYDVTVATTDDREATLSFTVGPVVDIMNNRDAPTFVGEETTIAVLVREGEFSVADEPVTIEVRDEEDNVVASETVTTDEDGFATIEYTPESSGEYEMEAEIDSDTSDGFDQFTAAEYTLGSDYELRSATLGLESTYGGYVETTEGPAANTDLEVTISQRRFGEDNEVILTESVTTDENGFFLLDYELPEDVEDDYFQVSVETTDGTPVATRFDSIFADELEDEGSTPDDVQLNADFEEFELSPDDPYTVEIEATDGGEPITNEEVTVSMQWDRDGPPLRTETVVTDADGTATVTGEFPDNSLDGVRPRGEVVLEYDGETYTQSFSSSLEEIDLRFDSGEIEPGTENTIRVEAFDQATEEPVEGVPQQFSALYVTNRQSAFATGELVSNESGTDEISIDVPANIAPNEGINYVDRYTSASTNRLPRISYPGSLTIETTRETDFGRPVAAPGEEIELIFDSEDDADATGIAYTDTYNPDRSIATSVSSQESTTLTVPADLEDGDQLGFYLWARSGDQTYSDRYVSVQIEDPEGINAAFETDVETPEPGQTVTFDASDSTADAGIETYVWDFGDGTTTETEDPTIDHAFETDGSYTVELTVVDTEGNEASTTQAVDVATDDSAADDRNVTVRLEPTDENIQVDQNQTFDVVVEDATDGISAYDVIIASADQNIATIDGFKQTVDPTFDDAELGSDGTLYLEAALGENTYEANEETVIATITVQGVSEGSTELTIETNASVSDANVEQYSVASTNGSTVTVTDEPTIDPVVGDTPPQDLDGDGTFEDIDGDGELTIFDVQTLFSNLDKESVQNNADVFDFAGAGSDEVTVFDVQALFGQV